MSLKDNYSNVKQRLVNVVNNVVGVNAEPEVQLDAIQYIKKASYEVPDELMQYHSLQNRLMDEDISEICNQYGIYDCSLNFYNDAIETGLADMIINKKVDLVFDKDVQYIENGTSSNYYDVGFKSTMRDMLIGGSSLCILSKYDPVFNKSKVISYPAYKFYQYDENTVVTFTCIKRNIFDMKMYGYDEEQDITYIYTSKYDFADKKKDEEIRLDSVVTGKIFEVFNYEREYGDLYKARESILSYDLTSTQINIETDMSSTQIHADAEYESNVRMNKKVHIRYNSPLNMEGKQMFEVIQPNFNGSSLWASATKWLANSCLVAGLSPDVLEISSLTNVKTGVSDNETEKTAITINRLKDDMSMLINDFVSRFYNLEIDFGVHGKQSMESRVKTSSQMTSSVSEKIKYENPYFTDEKLLEEVLIYKVENNIPFTKQEREYYVAEGMLNELPDVLAENAGIDQSSDVSQDGGEVAASTENSDNTTNNQESQQI